MAFFIFAGSEWGRVARALGAEDHALPHRLHSTLRGDAEDAAREAADRVRSLPVKGRGHTGLRQRVAAGLRVTGISGFFRVTTSMPSGQEIIPRGLDRKSGWTHPVFGHSPTVRQRPYRSGWFLDTFQDSSDAIENDLEDVLDKAADTIAAAGFGP
jgi:hypothetical protein